MSTEPLVATGATDITLEPDLHRAVDPDMTLGRDLCLGVSMAPGGSTGRVNQHGPHSSMASGYQHGLRCNLDPWHQHGL